MVCIEKQVFKEVPNALPKEALSVLMRPSANNGEKPLFYDKIVNHFISMFNRCNSSCHVQTNLSKSNRLSSGMNNRMSPGVPSVNDSLHVLVS